MNTPKKKTMSAAAKAHIAAAAKARWAKIKAARGGEPTQAPEVARTIETGMAEAKTRFAKSLARTTGFDHQLHADRLDELNTQAMAARRVDIALGLFCFELKEIHLQSGQFGRWLAEHRPQLAEQHASGSWQPAKSLETAMWLAKSALDVCGHQIGDYIDLVKKHFPHTGGKSDSAQLMLLPEAKLPEEFKALRDEIFKLVDGKSQRQLRSEFKQIDEASGTPKRGRLPGCKGTTAEQRAAAALATEAATLAERQIQWAEHTVWLLESADDAAALGLPDDVLADHRDACQTMAGYLTRLLQTRRAK